MFENLLDLPVVRFLIVGGAVYGFGMGLLGLLVEKLRMPPKRASFIMLVVTLQVSFLLNHFWSFSSVPAEDVAEFVRRWVMYCGARVGPMALEWLGAAVLVDRLRVPYILANSLAVGLGFVFVYLLSASMIFVER